MITREELNTIYQEELGRDPDASGLATYLDQAKGYSADDVRGFVQGSREKAIREYVTLGQKRGEDFYASGMGLGDEFSATEGGQVVWLKEGQNLDSDYYQDITDQMGDFKRTGWRAYLDTGSKGGGGILGSIDGVLGTDLQEQIGALVPNEVKAYYAAQTGNIGIRMLGGEQWQNEASSVFEDNLGLQKGEWDRYYDAAVSAAGMIAGAATGPFGIALAAGVTAAQGVSKKIGGTYAERSGTSWGDVLQQTAMAAGSTAAAGYGGAVGAGLFGTAEAKLAGNDWRTSLLQGGISAATAGIGGMKDVQAGTRAAASAAVNMAGTYALTKDFAQAAVAGATSYAGTTAKAFGKPAALLTRIGVAALQSQFADDQTDFWGSAIFNIAQQTAGDIATGRGGTGKLGDYDPRNWSTAGLVSGLTSANTWIPARVYDANVIDGSPWFNREGARFVGRPDALGTRKVDWSVSPDTRLVGNIEDYQAWKDVNVPQATGVYNEYGEELWSFGSSGLATRRELSSAMKRDQYNQMVEQRRSSKGIDKMLEYEKMQQSVLDGALRRSDFDSWRPIVR